MAGLRKHLMLLVCFGLTGATLPAAETTATQATSSTTGIVDVSLTQAGSLTGRYLDGEGRGVDGALVVVAQADRIVSRTNTDHSGAWQVHGLRQGVYQVTTGQQTQTLRAWEGLSAPPSSRQLLTTVRSDRIVRGQLGLIGGSVGSTVGAVGGVAGAAAGGFSVTESMDAQDNADAAVKEAAELREMMHQLMSP